MEIMSIAGGMTLEWEHTGDSIMSLREDQVADIYMRLKRHQEMLKECQDARQREHDLRVSLSGSLEAIRERLEEETNDLEKIWMHYQDEAKETGSNYLKWMGVGVFQSWERLRAILRDDIRPPY